MLWRAYGFIISFSLVSLSFLYCPKKVEIPEIDKAKEAIKRAEEIGATKYPEYEKAKNYLKMAEENFQKKNYPDAKAYAITSKELAEEAIRKFQEEMKKPKVEEEKKEYEIKEETKLPPPSEIEGVNPEDILGPSTLGRGYQLKSLEKIYFDFDRYNIKDSEIPKLEKNYEIIKGLFEKNKKIFLIIEGHCDERGTNEYNLELGLRRANSIKRYLVMRGLDEERIKVVSFGEEFPEEPCPPPQCQDESKWAKNRRAVFAISQER